MQLALTVFFVSAHLFLSPVAAVDFSFYGQYSNCYGPRSLFVRGAASGVCYGGPPARSIQADGVPGGAKAQAYSGGGCSNYVTEVGSGNNCLSGGSDKNSVNWFYPWKKLVRKTPEPEPKFTVTYEQPGAGLREIVIPSGHVARALKLVEARDYDTLAEFPTVSESGMVFLPWPRTQF